MENEILSVKDAPEIWATAKRLYPEICKLCLPRRIVPPHGYANPMVYATTLFALLSPAAQGRKQSSTSGLELMSWEIVRHDVPTYFIGDEFLRAIAATQPPEDYKVGNIKWPMPAFVMGVPTKTLLEMTGYAVYYIGVAKIPAGRGLMPDARVVKAMPNIMGGQNDVERFVFHYSACYGGNMSIMDYTTTYSLDHRISEISVEKEYVDWNKGECAVLGAPSVEHDKKFQAVMNSLTCKLLLGMTARPALIEHGECIRKAKVKHGVEKDALWSPNTIGFKYKAVRTTSEGNGDGAKYRTHWRRGHFRNQAFGKGLSEHKLIWIEPVLVNAE